MIQLAERITWVLGGGLVLVIGVYFGVLGAPSPIPKIAIESVALENQTQLEKTLTKESRQKLHKKLEVKAGTEGGKASSKARRRKIPREFRQVNEAVFQRISNLTDAIHEAKKLSSRVKENKDGSNSLEIFDFDQGSMLPDLGFQEHDIVEYLDGQKIDFSSKLEAQQLFYELRDRALTGEPIVVDVLRNGRPTQVVVALKR